MAPSPSVSLSTALHVRVGTDGDDVLHIRSDGRLVGDEWRPGLVNEGRLEGWTWAVVKTAKKSQRSLRVFELVPETDEQRVCIGSLSVAGRFEITKKYNNPREAEAAWKARAQNSR